MPGGDQLIIIILIQKTPITFKQCNIPAMRAKLTELNNEVQKEIVRGFLRALLADRD
jgi:hypothetical protein